MNTTAQRAPGDLQAIIDRLGLTIKSEFVPFSKSRNAKEKHKTLNWRVTLCQQRQQENGFPITREIIAIDYSAGAAHCPAYKLFVRQAGGRDSIMRDEMLTAECETGFAVRMGEGTGMQFKGARIEPNALDVIHSLVMDSDVLDYSNYEEWAANTGYDPDSRKGEALYRQCLEIALKLRNGIGEAGLSELREAFQDY